MREIEQLFYVTNSSVFRKLYRKHLEHYGSGGVSCGRCKPHHGCNGWIRWRDRSWKRHRQTKYKQKG